MAEIYQLDDHNRGLDTNGLVAAAALANGGGLPARGDRAADVSDDYAEDV